MKLLVTMFFFLGSFLLHAQQAFQTQNEKQIKEWLKEAHKNKEIDKPSQERIIELIDLLQEEKHATDPNAVYNYGRAIHKALQPSFSIPNHTYSKGAVLLMAEAEQAYRHAILTCDCHGRANIMIGMLYNQQQKYYVSEPYLEKGLELDEGSNDWMIAANQYLLSGAYTNNTKTPKYQTVYKKFKSFAPKHKDPYYLKMYRMYIPYYED